MCVSLSLMLVVLEIWSKNTSSLVGVHAFTRLSLIDVLSAGWLYQTVLHTRVKMAKVSSHGVVFSFFPTTCTES